MGSVVWILIRLLEECLQVLDVCVCTSSHQKTLGAEEARTRDGARQTIVSK